MIFYYIMFFSDFGVLKTSWIELFNLIKMGGQSGSWTPTKRRGPIAAEFQGPGPAAIGLPSLFGSKYLLLF